MFYTFSWLFFLAATLSLAAQKTTAPAFKVVPLGVRGGSDESNLSAYLVAPAKGEDYICLDAGTLRAGLEKAVSGGIFAEDATRVLKRHIKGYFISHPHLDHVAGLIINSPDDTAKSIYGLPFCLEVLKEKYFTWKSWANFANEGEKPVLNKYHYNYLTAGVETEINHTRMQVKAFQLSHSNPFLSTAFLVRSGADYILYLGDTGADEIEKSDRLQLLWKEITPLIRGGNLKGIFIEVSYPDEQPRNLLFGHLTPQLLMQEMKGLATLAGQQALQKCPIVITHMKPSGSNEMDIKKQLVRQNTLGLKMLFPRQAQLIKL